MSLFKILLSAATLSLIVGCASAPDDRAVPTGERAAAAPRAETELPKAKDQNAQIAPEIKERLAVLALRGIEQPGTNPALDPNGLIGLSRAEAFATLGTPDQIHEVSPATVWRYAMGTCQLDLYFFMDLGTSAFRVLTYDVRTKRSGRAAKKSCLGQIRAASRAQ